MKTRAQPGALVVPVLFFAVATAIGCENSAAEDDKKSIESADGGFDSKDRDSGEGRDASIGDTPESADAFPGPNSAGCVLVVESNLCECESEPVTGEPCNCGYWCENLGAKAKYRSCSKKDGWRPPIPNSWCQFGVGVFAEPGE